MPCFNNKDHRNCFIKYLSRWKHKVIEVIFYSVYARLLLEAHEAMIMTSAIEIRELELSSTSTIVSHVI